MKSEFQTSAPLIGHVAKVLISVTLLIAGVLSVMPLLPASASDPVNVQCPTSDPNGFPLTTISGLTYYIFDSGNTRTYGINTPNHSPSGGIPGISEYCVFEGYPSPYIVPSSGNALFGSWNVEVGSTTTKSIGFGRAGGNLDNLPFDGASSDVGDATYSSLPSSTDLIILVHIQDIAIKTDGNLQCDPEQSCWRRLSLAPPPPDGSVPEFGSSAIGVFVGTVASMGALLLFRRRRIDAAPVSSIKS